MKKLIIFTLSSLFAFYASAYPCDNKTKDTITTSGYYQHNRNTQQTTRCVWPPCDDEW
ncbi:hypothetical protein [Proteus mirabilis]|uniref:hypothetical protein n=1 Tax=Proteus mirabilis TaxID=584 RepID=UPI0029ED7AFC|nr:hypothetical protein [Proteus mirabilis]